jgi:serine/threonine protein kinase/tetratricopeptide (TPR) repeat protein
MIQFPVSYGKYELLQLIATGGMAEVYLARARGHERIERHLAIKRIRPELEDDPRLVRMFINEARIGVHLNHPNIVQIYELGKNGESYFIAMEHLFGHDLTRLVKTLRRQNERLPQAVCVFIVAEVCRGIGYAHRWTPPSSEGPPGLIHQDISPHNILVTFAGEIKLVDFGIARLLHEVTTKDPGEDERPGAGKFAYMSPEQASGQPFDHRSDLFSTGIVLWELLVGRRLFDDADPNEKLRKVTEAEVPDPRTLGVDVDPSLWAILQQALAIDPAQRHTNAEAFEEDLRAWLFDHRARVDRRLVSQWIRQAFPDDEDPSRKTPLLSHMIRDVERLAQSQPSHTPMVAASSSPPHHHEGERKPVTLLIVDVDGLTTLSDQLEPEDMFKRNYRLLRWVRKIAVHYGGHLQRSNDYRLTLLFGVPLTKVDDLVRALECALTLQREAPQLAARGLPVHLAIGVHRGDVFVRPSKPRVSYMARGDTARHARRLCESAEHGQVLVSDDVLAHATQRFVLQTGPKILPRGGRPGRPSYILEQKRRGSGLRGHGPWLARAEEIQIVRDALIALADERGDALAFHAEMGVGKTRLLNEIRGLARRRGVRCAVVRCNVGGRERPLEGLKELLLGLMGIQGTPSLELLKQEFSPRLGVEFTTQERDHLIVLSGVRLEPAPSPLDIAEALERFVSVLAHEAPLLIGLDDLHEASNEEARALRRLVLLTERCPILMLGTWDERGETQVPFPTTYVLEPLDRKGVMRLVSHQFGDRPVEASVVDFFERTCEGNPHYVEEMVRCLTARGAFEESVGSVQLTPSRSTDAIPPSLVGLLAARVDALAPATKGLLQLACIIGKRFPEELLATAAGLEDLTTLLHDLEAHKLVARTPSPGEWTLSSDLVQESTLRGILAGQRREYHRMVVGALLSLHGEETPTVWRDLTHHCALGGDWVEAARFAYRAGCELEREQLLGPAQDIYERGLQFVRKAPRTPETWDARTQGEAMLCCQLGAVLQLQGDDVAAVRHLRVALDISGDAGIPWVEAQAHLELGGAFAQRHDARLAAAHLNQALELGRSRGDASTERLALEALANLAHQEGRNAEAEEILETVIGMAQGDIATLARCQLGLASRFLRSAEYDRATPLLEKALSSTRILQDRILEGRVLNNMGLLKMWSGQSKEALACFREALRVREGVGYRRGIIINHHNMGAVHFQENRLSRAWVCFSRSMELATEIGWMHGIWLNEMYLKYLASLLEGQPVEDLLKLTETVRAADEIELAATGSWLGGRLLLLKDRSEEAVPHLESGLQLAERWELMPLATLLRDLLSRGVSSQRPPG